MTHVPRNRQRWRVSDQLSRQQPGDTLRHWLFDPGSLTRRVQRACPGRFEVRVERQGWERPRLDEWRALRLRPPRRALIREVHLLCDGCPWVFARTVLPLTTLRGRGQRLARLGNRPLGAVLFADPHLRRGPVEVTRVLPGERLFAAAVQGLRQAPVEIWGRRSVFWLDGKPLLVSEFFLPGIVGCGQPGARGHSN